MTALKGKASVVLRVAEDVVLVGAAAITAYTQTHDPRAVETAVTATPLVRSGIAWLLTNGRSSGLIQAVRLVREALTVVQEQAEKPKAEVG